MKKKLYQLIISYSLALTACITPYLSFAQVMFQKQIPFVNLYQAKQTSDSGNIATGWYFNQNGNQDVCLVKTNPSGDTLWTKTFGEVEDVLANSIDHTSDHGYIISGWTYANPPLGSMMYVIKTNSFGDTLWTKKYGGIGDQRSRCIEQTMDNGYIISGETNSFGAGNWDMYIIKTDSIGNVEWSKTLGTPDDDYCYSICKTIDSGYIALGTMKINSVNSDLMLVKLNSQGDTLWTKCYGDSTTGQLSQEIGLKIIQNSDHGFAIIGYTNSFGVGAGDVYFLLTDSIGNLLWSKTYGGIKYDWGYSIVQTTDNEYLISGTTASFGTVMSSSYVIKTDINGDIIWSKKYNDTYGSIAVSIHQTFDGGYWIAGLENELMKLNPIGLSGCFENNVSTINTNPNTQTLKIPILITQPNSVTIPTETIVGSGLSIINVCTTVNSEENISSDYSIRIFPNPSEDYITIRSSTPLKNAQILIYNSTGEKIYSAGLNGYSATINCGQLTKGIYLIKILDNEKYYNEKLIIR